MAVQQVLCKLMELAEHKYYRNCCCDDDRLRGSDFMDIVWFSVCQRNSPNSAGLGPASVISIHFSSV